MRASTFVIPRMHVSPSMLHALILVILLQQSRPQLHVDSAIKIATRHCANYSFSGRFDASQRLCSSCPTACGAPHFLLVLSPKCGSSTFHGLLTSHPHVAEVPKVVEFFASSRPFSSTSARRTMPVVKPTSLATLAKATKIPRSVLHRLLAGSAYAPGRCPEFT